LKELDVDGRGDEYEGLEVAESLALFDRYLDPSGAIRGPDKYHIKLQTAAGFIALVPLF